MDELTIEELREALGIQVIETNRLQAKVDALEDELEEWKDSCDPGVDKAALKGVEDSEHHCAWCNSPIDCGPIKGADHE